MCHFGLMCTSKPAVTVREKLQANAALPNTAPRRLSWIFRFCRTWAGSENRPSPKSSFRWSLFSRWKTRPVLRLEKFEGGEMWTRPATAWSSKGSEEPLLVNELFFVSCKSDRQVVHSVAIISLLTLVPMLCTTCFIKPALNLGTEHWGI